MGSDGFGLFCRCSSRRLSVCTAWSRLVARSVGRFDQPRAPCRHFAPICGTRGRGPVRPAESSASRAVIPIGSQRCQPLGRRPHPFTSCCSRRDPVSRRVRLGVATARSRHDSRTWRAPHRALPDGAASWQRASSSVPSAPPARAGAPDHDRSGPDRRPDARGRSSRRDSTGTYGGWPDLPMLGFLSFDRRGGQSGSPQTGARRLRRAREGEVCRRRDGLGIDRCGVAPAR